MTTKAAQLCARMSQNSVIQCRLFSLIVHAKLVFTIISNICTLFEVTPGTVFRPSNDDVNPVQFWLLLDTCDTGQVNEY